MRNATRMELPVIGRALVLALAIGAAPGGPLGAPLGGPLGGPLGAQGSPQWREIGKTSTGNTVYLDPRSVARDSSGIITATVRVVYATPVETPQGPITGSRAVAMFDCKERKVAVKESIIWHDERRGTIYRRSVPARPGFGPALTSTFAHVALEHLCATR